jgi:hypothetical protein
MAAEKDWPRYIIASIGYYLKPILTAQNWPSLLDGIEERTDAFIQSSNRAEFRITGPFVKQLSAGYWQALVDINVLLSSRFDGPLKNAYDLTAMAGIVEAALDQPIPVWNYGGQPGDYVDGDASTQVFLGNLIPRLGQSCRVLNFGQIDTVDRLKQYEAEGRYMLELYANQ